MSWQKVILAGVLAVLAVLVVIGLTKDYKDYLNNQKAVTNLKAQIGDLIGDSEATATDIEFYSDPDNLTKELRSRFNYKKVGEKLLIVVPKEE